MAFLPNLFALAVDKLEANPPTDPVSFANGWADAFYNGPIAQSIVRAVRDARPM